jgi:putative FmdB family regulatory protein
MSVFDYTNCHLRRDQVGIAVYNVPSYQEEGMPSYEYRCLDCRKRFDVFLTYKEYGMVEVRCKHCQSAHVQRKIGRVRVTRSTPDRMQGLADPSRMNSIEDDPRALGSMMREMRSELGEQMPSEFDEVVDRLDHGQSPEQIDSALPDLSDDYSSGESSSLDSNSFDSDL